MSDDAGLLSRELFRFKNAFFEAEADLRRLRRNQEISETRHSETERKLRAAETVVEAARIVQRMFADNWLSMGEPDWSKKLRAALAEYDTAASGEKEKL